MIYKNKACLQYNNLVSLVILKLIIGILEF